MQVDDQGNIKANKSLSDRAKNTARGAAKGAQAAASVAGSFSSKTPTSGQSSAPGGGAKPKGLTGLAKGKTRGGKTPKAGLGGKGLKPGSGTKPGASGKPGGVGSGGKHAAPKGKSLKPGSDRSVGQKTKDNAKKKVDQWASSAPSGTNKNDGGSKNGDKKSLTRTARDAVKKADEAKAPKGRGAGWVGGSKNKRLSEKFNDSIESINTPDDQKPGAVGKIASAQKDRTKRYGRYAQAAMSLKHGDPSKAIATIRQEGLKNVGKDLTIGPFILVGVSLAAVILIVIAALTMGSIVMAGMSGGPQAQAETQGVDAAMSSGMSESDIKGFRSVAHNNLLPWAILASLSVSEAGKDGTITGHILEGFVSCKLIPDDPDNWILGNVDEVHAFRARKITIDRGGRVPSSQATCPKPRRDPDMPDDIDVSELNPVPTNVVGGACHKPDAYGPSSGDRGGWTCVVVWSVVKAHGPFAVLDIYPKAMKKSDDASRTGVFMAGKIYDSVSGKAGYHGEASLLTESIVHDSGLYVDHDSDEYEDRRNTFVDALNSLPIDHANDEDLPGNTDEAKIGEYIPMTRQIMFMHNVYDVAQAWALGREMSWTGGCIPNIDYNGEAVAGLSTQQTKNAYAIVQAASKMGLGSKAGKIGVAVALAESSLKNLANDGSSTLTIMGTGRQLTDHEREVARESLKYPHQGIGHNLDSMGLFQQRPSAGWGTPTSLMNPAKSATFFFEHLVEVDGWENMPPSEAAQKVQGSSDASGSIYRRRMEHAGRIVSELLDHPADDGGYSQPNSGSTGNTGPSGAGSVSSMGCSSAGAVQVAVDGPEVTLPNDPNVDAAVRGMSIKTPNAAVAQGIAAGLAYLGTPYVWGGGNAQGPDNGCARAGGAKNSCGSLIGFDCSGLTKYVLAQAGFTIPGGSTAQRSAGVSVPLSVAVPGDILGYPGHVSIYLGVINGTRYQLEAPDIGMNLRVVPVFRSDIDPVAHRYWS